MNKLFIMSAVAMCVFQVQAQTTNSNQNSQTSSGATSFGGGAGGSSNQTQNANAGSTSTSFGGGSGGSSNQTQGSYSTSGSTAYGGSSSGGAGGSSTVSGLQNYVVMTSPEKSESTVNSNQNGTLTTNMTGGTDSTQRMVQSGGTDSTQRIVQSGESISRVEYSGDYTIKNVPSVNGPPLTTSNDTCMGSTSGSANGPGFGIGFGTTWTDEHCKDLKTSRELWNKGMKAASLAIDCMNPRAKAALEMTGTKCPQSMTIEERQVAFGAQASAEGAAPSPGLPTAAVVSSIPGVASNSATYTSWNNSEHGR